MIGVLLFTALLLADGKGEWSPILEYTGGRSGNLGAYYHDDSWHLGAAFHGDLDDSKIINGGRIKGGLGFDNGLKLGGDLQVHTGGGLRENSDWSPIIVHTGGGSGYLGADYRGENWHIGAAVHVDVDKPGFIDGGRIQGGFKFDNGLELNGYLQGHSGGNVEGGIQGGFNLKNDLNLNGYLKGSSGGTAEVGIGLTIPLGQKGRLSLVAGIEFRWDSLQCPRLFLRM